MKSDDRRDWKNVTGSQVLNGWHRGSGRRKFIFGGRVGPAVRGRTPDAKFPG